MKTTKNTLPINDELPELELDSLELDNFQLDDDDEELNFFPFKCYCNRQTTTKL
jgi:hypothetical protein